MEILKADWKLFRERVSGWQEHYMEQLAKEYSVVLVTGPRQVGKTTMLQKLMEGTDRGICNAR